MCCVCRLRELYREIDTASSKVMFEDSTDRMPPTFGRSSKKGDIYQLVRKKEKRVGGGGGQKSICMQLYVILKQ